MTKIAIEGSEVGSLAIYRVPFSGINWFRYQVFDHESQVDYGPMFETRFDADIYAMGLECWRRLDRLNVTV